MCKLNLKRKVTIFAESPLFETSLHLKACCVARPQLKEISFEVFVKDSIEKVSSDFG